VLTKIPWLRIIEIKGRKSGEFELQMGDEKMMMSLRGKRERKGRKRERVPNGKGGNEI